jgi:hypothetical protein
MSRLTSLADFRCTRRRVSQLRIRATAAARVTPVVSGRVSATTG